jgi:IS5 family transposase
MQLFPLVEMYKGEKNMFSLKEFVKNGLLKAVGKMADYQIILNSAGWLEKGVLDEADLSEIQMAIDAQYAKVEEAEV